MNKRSLVNILLFVILLCFIVFFINKKNSPAEVQRLSSLDISEITEIFIPRKQGKNIRFRKTETSNWYMLEPYQIKAHSFRINTLLSLTQTPVNTAYAIEQLELSDYALDKPRAIIIFNNTQIKFGKSNPMNNKRYLLSENKMFLVYDQLYPLVNAQAVSFIDLSLLPEDFQIVKIQTPAVDIQLQNSQWQSTDNKLNADQIQSLLQHWRSVQAFAVHKYLARKQLGEIKIYSKTGNLTFIVSDTDPWLILALPQLGIEYHLDKSFKNRLFGQIEASPDNA